MNYVADPLERAGNYWSIDIGDVGLGEDASTYPAGVMEKLADKA